MLPVSDSLVVPSGDGVVEELAQEVSEAAAASAATTTDPEAERQSEIDAKRAKKDARRTTRKSTLDARRTEKATRRDARREAERLNAAPQITVEFFPEEPPDPGDTPPVAEETEPGQPEILRVRNHGDVSVVLSRIESMQQPDVWSALDITIPAGGTSLLESGPYVASPELRTAVATVWSEQTVCPECHGVILTTAQSGSTQTYHVSVLCGATASTVNTDPGDSRQGNHNKQRQRKQRARRRDAHQKRQDRQQAKRRRGR